MPRPLIWDLTSGLRPKAFAVAERRATLPALLYPTFRGSEIPVCLVIRGHQPNWPLLCDAGIAQEVIIGTACKRRGVNIFIAENREVIFADEYE